MFIGAVLLHALVTSLILLSIFQVLSNLQALSILKKLQILNASLKILQFQRLVLPNIAIILGTPDRLFPKTQQ
jgi:hypothetical protein